MLTCKELTEIVTEYLEGRLSFGQRVQFHMHVGMCRHCRAYLRQMKITVRTLGKLPAEPMPEHVKDELLVRFRGMRRGDKPVAAPAGGGARGWAAAAALLVTSIVGAFVFGGEEGPILGSFARCVFTHVGAALLAIVAVHLTARRPVAAGTLAALGAAGGSLGYLALPVACPYSHVTAHLLAVHVGAIALGTLLAAGTSLVRSRPA